MTRSNISKFLIVIVVLITGILLMACVPNITFKRLVYSENADIKENITIRNVTDYRDPSGKSDKAQPTRLGTIRGGYGNPFALEVKGGGTVAGEVEKTVIQAFTQSGYSVEKSGAPLLDVIIIDFWCDGMIGYKLSIYVIINLIAADGKTVLFKKRITDSKGFSTFVGYGPMENAYNAMMNEIGVQTAQMAKSKEFLDALQKAK